MPESHTGRTDGWSHRRLLRALGSYLNLQGACYLALEARDGGFSWQFAPRGDRSRTEGGRAGAEDLLALDASYGRTLRGGRRGRWFGRPPTPTPLAWHPLVPEGYDRALGVVGAWLDLQGLRLARLEEGEERLRVWYDLGPGTGHRTACFDREQLAALQEAARHHRSRTAQP